VFKRIAFWFVLTASIAVVLLSSFHAYYIRTDGGGQLFWNDKEALLFLQVNRTGYRMTYLGVLQEMVREMLPFGVPKPHDTHSSVVVLRMTADSIERDILDNFWIAGIEPFEGALYTGNLLPGGTLMKWAGTHFERPTPEELKNYYAAANNLPAGPSYDNVAGWSKRTIAGEVARQSPTDYNETDTKITIELEGKQLTFTMNSGFISHEAYVELRRPGEQKPQRIWSLDEKPHRVSKREYEAAFY